MLGLCCFFGGLNGAPWESFVGLKTSNGKGFVLRVFSSHFEGYVGPMLGHMGPMWGPCWAYVVLSVDLMVLPGSLLGC